MIIHEENVANLTIPKLRELVKSAENKFGRKITVIVGTKEEVSDQKMHELLPFVEEKVRKHKMKFAATTVIMPGIGAVTLNILFAEYLHDENACANFLVKQKKYGLIKVNLVD